MAKDPAPDASVSVTTDEVRVGKTFEAERFPVPAIAFDIESVADEPVRIRLVDDIPESFAMEGVGFHPDYEGDNWTAYRDNRVAYERTLDPGEEVLTVYGIRIDDSDEAADFLDEPTVELIEHGEAANTGDVLGRETTQVVRDALSGESDDELAGLGPDAAADESAPEPRELDDDPESILGDRDESVTTVDTSAETAEESDAETDEDEDMETDEATDEDAETDASEDTETDEGEDEETEESEDEPESVSSSAAAKRFDPRDWDQRHETTHVTSDETDATPTEADEGDAEPTASPTATPGSVTAALAAEIRAGTVDDDDLAVIDEALASEVPTSIDVRVSRLQSQTEDLLAYRDALADFLDENGTAEEVLGDVSEGLADLSKQVDSLEASLADADAERADLNAEVASVAETVEDVSATVEDVAGRVDTLESDLAAVETTTESLSDRLDAVESLEDDIEAIHDELEELQSFREQLNSAFGPGE
mgnify:CR=1 FL=1